MNRTQTGLFTAVTAFVLWGISPLLWRQLQSLSPQELMLHRALWPFLIFTTFIFASGRGREFLGSITKRRNVVGLLISSTLISLNWFIFLKGIDVHRVAELSFGYFINPVLSIAIASFFFGESLPRHKRISLMFILLGISIQMVTLTDLPFYALGVAFTFATYAAVRKKFPIDSLFAQTFESLFIAIFGLIFVRHDASIFSDAVTKGPFFFSVPVITTLSVAPLTLYLFALKRLPLNSMAYLQYLTPTMKLMVALLLFNETLTDNQIVSFGVVWTGIIYMLSKEYGTALHIRSLLQTKPELH